MRALVMPDVVEVRLILIASGLALGENDLDDEVASAPSEFI